MNDIETSEITTSPKVRALIVAGVAGGTGTGFWSQANHFDNALLEKTTRCRTATDGDFPR